MTMTAVGTPRVTMHLEAKTPDCICDKLSRCGGIVVIQFQCPEHGHTTDPLVAYHTHAVQVRKTTVGTHRRS